MEILIKKQSGEVVLTNCKNIREALKDYFTKTDEKPIAAELRAYNKQGDYVGGMRWNEVELRGAYPVKSTAKVVPAVQFTMAGLLAEAHLNNQ